MLHVHISNARCTRLGPGNYRLTAQIGGPTSTNKARKSDYANADSANAEWNEPFGTSSLFPIIEAGRPGTLALRQHHRWPKRSEDIGTCEIVFSLQKTVYTGVFMSREGVEVGRLELTAETRMEGLATMGDQAKRDVDAMKRAHDIPTLPDGSNPIPALVSLDPWVALRDRLKALDPIVAAVDELAKVHPWVTLAWEVVTMAYKVMKAQMERDEKIEALVQTMSDCCDVTEHAEKLKDYTTHFNAVFEKILHQVMECAYFIRDYTNKSFGVRIVDETLSPAVNDQIEAFRSEFERLRKILSDYAVAHCELQVYRVLNVAQDVLKAIEDNIAITALSEMQYTANAHPDPAAVCLDGTRVEIIDAIVRWAGGIDVADLDTGDHLRSPQNNSGTAGSKMPPIDPTARVLWLCGVAGSGKSSIARSVAARLRARGRLGCIYAFSSKFADTNPSNLFSTIAQDLAGLDPTRKRELVNLVKDDKALRTSKNPTEQFEQFIVEASKNVPTIGELLIIIDAFDESGDIDVRKGVLSVLTESAHLLPKGMRILVTSRSENDVVEALKPPFPCLTRLRMEEIPATSGDVATFVNNQLSRLGLANDDLDKLAKKAESSFQWASAACRYIRDQSTGGDAPQDRLRDILQPDLGVGDLNSLDVLYSTILSREFPVHQPRPLLRLKRVLGQILCAQEPLTQEGLAALAPPYSDITVHLLQNILQHLGSLLSGTHEKNTPVAPLHSSLRDFLCDKTRSGPYHVALQEASDLMAVACVNFLKSTEGLHFNMWGFPTSYKTNLEALELGILKENSLPHHLLYACWYWTTHIHNVNVLDDSLQKDILGFLEDNYLHWLEVMSVCIRSPQNALALLQSKTTLPDLSATVRDAMQFATVFAMPISQSAPHIYLSALAFAPEKSVLCKQLSHYDAMLELVRGRLHDWPHIIHILNGHTSGVYSVSFSPDGTRIVSGSYDDTARIWDVDKGHAVGYPLTGHTDDINSVAFSPDGTVVASGSDDHTIRIWDANTGDAIGHPLAGHTDWVMSVTFSPDGKRIASGSRDNTVCLWDVATRKPIGAPLARHTALVISVAFSPDGKRIASGARDCTVRLWNADTGGAIGEPLTGHTGNVNSVAFSPDSTRIVSGSDDRTIRFWDAAAGEMIKRLSIEHTSPIISIAFSPDGKRIVSGSSDNTVDLWDADTGQRSGEPLTGHAGSVYSVTFSPDGARIASSSDDMTIRIWDATSGDSVGKSHVGHSGGVNTVTFSPDSTRVISGSGDSICFWDVGTGHAVREPLVGHTSRAPPFALSPDGTRIASGANNHAIHIWNAWTGDAVAQPSAGHSGLLIALAFSPDGTCIVSGSHDGSICLWDAKTGDVVGSPLKGHTDYVRSVTFSPDGARIASGSDDNTIRLWDPKTRDAIGNPLKGHADYVRSVVFSPDGSRIASGSDDKSIRLWDAKTGIVIGNPFTGHTGWVYSVAFSPDGERIASGSRDETVRLWDTKTGEAIGKPFLGHSLPVNTVAFSPDGKYIASGSDDHTVRLWDVDTTEELRELSQSSTIVAPRRLQYPSVLFPKNDFRLEEDGWIRGPEGELYVWIPPAHRLGLLHPNNIFVFGAHNTNLDFRHFKCGKDWADIDLAPRNNV